MPSFGSRLLTYFLSACGADRPFRSSDAAIDRLEELSLRPAPYGPPKRLRQDVRVAVDFHCGWPVYTLNPLHSLPQCAVIYLHGGAWVEEIHPAHWKLAAQIAAESRVTVIVPIYPLLPRGTAQVVVENTADLVRKYVETYGAEHLSIAGDSAGAQIALSTALLLREQKGMRLRHTLLISPALDLSVSNSEIVNVERKDPWLRRVGCRVYAEKWQGNLAVTDMRVSPLFADLSCLGPLTIFSGTHDITNPDTRLLVTKARAAGVTVDYHEAPGLMHVYPLLPIREGREARRVIVDLFSHSRPLENTHLPATSAVTQ